MCHCLIYRWLYEPSANHSLVSSIVLFYLVLFKYCIYFLHIKSEFSRCDSSLSADAGISCLEKLVSSAKGKGKPGDFTDSILPSDLLLLLS
mgnify:CR=1 FL=1